MVEKKGDKLNDLKRSDLPSDKTHGQLVGQPLPELTSQLRWRSAPSHVITTFMDAVKYKIAWQKFHNVHSPKWNSIIRKMVELLAIIPTQVQPLPTSH